MTVGKTWNTRSLAIIAALGGLALLPASAEPPPDQGAPPAPERHVYLNGQAVDDIRGVTLVDMRVELAPDGSIHLTNPAYLVQRRPGMKAQIVRKTMVPLDKTAYLVSEVHAKGASPFAVKVWIGDRLAATIDGSEPRQTIDVTPLMVRGPNPVRLQVLEQHRPGQTPDPNAKIEITIGLGSMTNRVLAIDRVLMTWERQASESGRLKEERTIDLSK